MLLDYEKVKSNLEGTDVDLEMVTKDAVTTPYPIVIITGSHYIDLKWFRDELFDRFEVRSLVIDSVSFTSLLIHKVKDVEKDVTVIHIRLPLEKLVAGIMETDPSIPEIRARTLAEKEIKAEDFYEFDERTPKDMVLITYTGENEEITPSRFVDIAGEILTGVSHGE